jgi:FkbM family methyltransferase
VGVKTIAVEPLPDNLRLLYLNLLANGFSDVEVLPVALADKPGLLTLHGAGTGASLVPGWAKASALLARTVPVSTIDLLLSERLAGRRVVVKMDVEGAEDGVLAGATRLLAARPSPLWLVENDLSEHHPAGANPHFAGVFDRFFTAGYTARAAGEGGQPVGREDVRRWVAAGRSPAGAQNFIFARADT